jgi:hypothetical protein
MTTSWKRLLKPYSSALPTGQMSLLGAGED